MSHHTKNHNHSSGLWQGFAAGAVAGASVLFLLGTKKGRDVLKKAVEISEDLEKNLDSYVDNFEDDVKEEIQERLEPIVSTVEKETGLTNVLDKIKSISEVKKYTKKFFVKE